MTKPIGVFFGKNHDHSKNTAPFAPVFREIDKAGLEAYVVTSPETQLEQNGEFRDVHQLRIVDGKTAAVAIDSAFKADDFSVILDRTGTLKGDYRQTVLNDRAVRQIGQGKVGDRAALAERASVPHAFEFEGSALLGDAFDSAVSGMVVVEGLRIYHHVSPGFDALWSAVVVGADEGEKQIYVPVPKEIVPEEVVAGSFALTQEILHAAGKQHAFAAPSWSLIDGVWTVTKPNSGNVQFGALKKEKHPDAFVTRQNLGKHVAHIALEQQ